MQAAIILMDKIQLLKTKFKDKPYGIGIPKLFNICPETEGPTSEFFFVFPSHSSYFLGSFQKALEECNFAKFDACIWSFSNKYMFFDLFKRTQLNQFNDSFLQT